MMVEEHRNRFGGVDVFVAFDDQFEIVQFAVLAHKSDGGQIFDVFELAAGSCMGGAAGMRTGIVGTGEGGVRRISFCRGYRVFRGSLWGRGLFFF